MNPNTEKYFSEVPKIYAPRSVFSRDFTHKTTMNVNKLYPIFIDECLPGDTMNLHFQAFGRLLNPAIVPIMDELYFETLWFKCPMRLLWNNTFKFFGERENPNDSTDYVIPTINSDTGFAVGSLADHFGIPVGVANLDVNSLPFRMYNRVYNEWLRDQNLINSVTVPLDDLDDDSYYGLLTSAKMHDMFTSCLPTTQLGSPAILSLTGSAPVYGDGNGLLLNTKYLNNGVDTSWVGSWLSDHSTTGAASSSPQLSTGGVVATPAGTISSSHAGTDASRVIGVATKSQLGTVSSGLYADMTQVSGISVNDLRFLVKLQQYRERLLVGGHRYREIVSQFFHCDQLDNNKYVTEFLGMTRKMVDINTVVQTSSTDATSPLGALASYGVVNTHESGFTTSFLEHGYLMGLARFRHNPVYQQGLNKLWSRSTQLDFYNPMFNGLGEQPILNSQIMAQGKSVVDSNGEIIDDKAFGFNEYGCEYRMYPSLITGQLRSGIANTLDCFHLAQYFGTYTPAVGDTPGYYTPVLPVLNQSFIEENIPLDRVLSIASDESKGIPQFIMDFRFSYTCARVMPVRNVPAGLYSGI